MIALGVILFVVITILLIPVGVSGEYISGDFKASAKVGFFNFQLVPHKQKKEKKEPAEDASQKSIEDIAENEVKKKQKSKFKLNLNKDEIFALVKAAISSVGNFGRKLKVDRFLLHYTAAGKDPYNTAQIFGYVNAALSALAPLCAKRYKVKDCDVWTRVDFVEEKMSIDFALALSIRVGQILAVVFALVFSALVILIKNKLRLRKEHKDFVKAMNTEEGMN